MEEKWEVIGRKEELVFCRPCGPVGEGLPFIVGRSDTVGTKILYQMKAEGAWEKDRKGSVG